MFNFWSSKKTLNFFKKNVDHHHEIRQVVRPRVQPQDIVVERSFPENI